ncbi:MAG: TadE family protein [Bacillota bacterium]
MDGNRNGGPPGAAMVEFVIVVTLLMTILFALVDFGLLMNAKLVLVAAAREGARRAAIEGGATPAVYDRIRQQLSLGRIDPAGATIDITPKTATYGTAITVRIVYGYEPMFPVLRSVMGASVPLEATTISRSEKIR